MEEPCSSRFPSRCRWRSSAEVIKHFEQNGYYLLREGGKHSIYTNGVKTIPIKRHRTIDRITANELCKQAGLLPKF